MTEKLRLHTAPYEPTEMPNLTETPLTFDAARPYRGRSLAERHISLADNAVRRSIYAAETLLETFLDVHVHGRYGSVEHLDFYMAVSGDDLARLARGPK